MIITTQSPAHKEKRRAGFTLVEVLIGAGLGSFILAGVLSVFLFLGRSGANLGNYADMEKEARSGLERFGADSRQASDLTWNSANSITLVVNSTAVTYAYNSADGSFTRQVGTSAPTVVINGIQAFEFRGYKINGVLVDTTDLSTANLRTSASKQTKQIQLSLRASRSRVTLATATNIVLSARFIIRNKRVTA